MKVMFAWRASAWVWALRTLLVIPTTAIAASTLESAFIHLPGGFEEALATPGSPWLWDGLRRFAQRDAARVVGIFAFALAVHAVLASWVRVAWLDAMRATGERRFLANLVRALRVLPGAFALNVSFLALCGVSLGGVGFVAYLAWKAPTEIDRIRDLRALGVLACGGFVVPCARAMSDVAMSRWVHSRLAMNPREASGDGKMADWLEAFRRGVVALRPPVLVRYLASVGLAFLALALAVPIGATAPAWIAPLPVHGMAFVATLFRAAWLRHALTVSGPESPLAT